MRMPTRSACSVAALIALMTGLASGQGAAQTPAQDVTAAMQGQLSAQVLEGCSSELAQHCAEVTRGEGRLLACLYAYGDKLSGQCDYALYDAAVRLEQAVGAVTLSPANAARNSRRIVRTSKWVKAVWRSA